MRNLLTGIKHIIFGIVLMIIVPVLIVIFSALVVPFALLKPILEGFIEVCDIVNSAIKDGFKQFCKGLGIILGQKYEDD